MQDGAASSSAAAQGNYCLDKITANDLAATQKEKQETSEVQSNLPNRSEKEMYPHEPQILPLISSGQ